MTRPITTANLRALARKLGIEGAGTLDRTILVRRIAQMQSYDHHAAASIADLARHIDHVRRWSFVDLVLELQKAIEARDRARALKLHADIGKRLRKTPRST